MALSENRTNLRLLSVVARTVYLRSFASKRTIFRCVLYKRFRSLARKRDGNLPRRLRACGFSGSVSLPALPWRVADDPFDKRRGRGKKMRERKERGSTWPIALSPQRVTRFKSLTLLYRYPSSPACSCCQLYPPRVPYHRRRPPPARIDSSSSSCCLRHPRELCILGSCVGSTARDAHVALTRASR